jgi:hypothetical protein
MITEELLQSICIKVAQNLVKLPQEKEEIRDFQNLKSKLIFPQKERKIVTRISEQESRILFCNEIEELKEEVYYSIETPTERTYHFGKTLEEINFDSTGQSALFDMSLFEIEGINFQQKVNIELKAHNVEESHIAKDILKLFSEEQIGLFFHTVSSIDNGTLSNNRKTGILDKYINSISHFKNKWVPARNTKEKYILFAICILNQKVLLLKALKEHDIQDNDKITEFFKIEFKTTREKINFINSNFNNWIKEDLLK